MRGGYSAKYSPLGLGPRQRVAIRNKAMDAAMVAYHHAGQMRYSEGADRWSGIDLRKRAFLGQYPPAADCSAFYAWVMWDCTRAERLHDFVNGLGWIQGYTGSMQGHGKIVSLNHLLRADAIFYGGNRSVPGHVAMYIGNGRVISHGSPGGPRILSIHYRNDITICRRYIR